MHKISITILWVQPFSGYRSRYSSIGDNGEQVGKIAGNDSLARDGIWGQLSGDCPRSHWREDPLQCFGCTARVAPGEPASCWSSCCGKVEVPHVRFHSSSFTSILFSFVKPNLFWVPWSLRCDEIWILCWCYVIWLRRYHPCPNLNLKNLVTRLISVPISEQLLCSQKINLSETGSEK